MPWKNQIILLPLISRLLTFGLKLVNSFVVLTQSTGQMAMENIVHTTERQGLSAGGGIEAFLKSVFTFSSKSEME